MNIARKLKQTAIYWANPTPDGRGGHSYNTSTDIRCRWEEKQELFMDGNGKEVLSKAVIYVDQDLDINSYMYLGSLTNLDSSVDITNPEQITGAYPVRGKDKIPNIKGDTYLRKYWLVLKRNS